MLIKNVSTRIIGLEDFPEERPLVPGAVVDLTKYPVAQRETSQQLKNLFTKGDLLCLGRASIDPKVQQAMVTKTSLSKYEVKPESLYQNDVVVPAAKMQPQVEAFSRNRQHHQAQSPTVPERYNKPALAKYAQELELDREGVAPAFAEKEFQSREGHSFVQIQSADELYTIQVDPNTGTTFVDAGKKRVVESTKDSNANVFIDRLTYQPGDEEDPVRAEQRQKLRDKINEKIVQLVENKCLATKTNGKPCERMIVQGFRTCIHHMSPVDKLRYIEQKKPLAQPPNDKPVR